MLEELVWNRETGAASWGQAWVGKEPELVREVEQYQLDILGLALTH